MFRGALVQGFSRRYGEVAGIAAGATAFAILAKPPGLTFAALMQNPLPVLASYLIPAYSLGLALSYASVISWNPLASVGMRFPVVLLPLTMPFTALTGDWLTGSMISVAAAILVVAYIHAVYKPEETVKGFEEAVKQVSSLSPSRKALLVVIALGAAIVLALHVSGTLLQPPIVVVTGSMEPTIMRGDMLFLEKPSEIRVGDVIAYWRKGSIVVHRVIAIQAPGVYRTKGDVSDHPDPWAVPEENVIGRVKLIIPKVGYIPMAMIMYPEIPLTMLALAAAAIILSKRTRKRKLIAASLVIMAFLAPTVTGAALAAWDDMMKVNGSVEVKKLCPCLCVECCTCNCCNNSCINVKIANTGNYQADAVTIIIAYQGPAISPYRAVISGITYNATTVQLGSLPPSTSTKIHVILPANATPVDVGFHATYTLPNNIVYQAPGSWNRLNQYTWVKL